MTSMALNWPRQLILSIVWSKIFESVKVKNVESLGSKKSSIQAPHPHKKLRISDFDATRISNQ